jgi:hypothetical protein
LLTAAEAATLTNQRQWPVVAAMTCLNGYFINPALESLAEALLLAEGGAVAVWTSAGMDYAAGQAALLQAWVPLVVHSPGQTLGDAVRHAKAATPDLDVRRTWILFGDPTMQLVK